ncbi:MAG TPA: transposase, partial [Longimicrobiales bacterium]
MARARKRHVQQVLFDRKGRPTGPDGKPRGRGGRREGAGRKPKGARAGAPHKKRPTLKRWQPVHVVLRVVEDVGSLRKRHMYKALREATISVARRELNDLRDGAFRIVHLSIQRHHVHLLVEADHKLALSRGMQAFQISAAKHLNRAVSIVRIRRASPDALRAAGASGAANGLRAYSVTGAKRLLRELRELRRRGTVFPDRFHQEIISTPKQARHALAYVLNNWRKHREDRWDFAAQWSVDPYSTGSHFDGWKEREDAVVLWRLRETYQPMVVYLARTWLLREGWRKHGLIRVDEVPGARAVQRKRGTRAWMSRRK